MTLSILTLSAILFGLCTIFIQRKFNTILAKSLAKETRINEARRMREKPKSKRQGACVILGSGVGGCLSAAIASSHFEKVFIIDPISSTSDPKAFIPQIDQLHNFGPLSYEAFKSAWPNGIFEKVFKSFGGRLTSASRFPYQFITFAGILRWDTKSPGIVDINEIPKAVTISRRGLHKVLRCLIEEYTPNTKLIIGKPIQARFSHSGKFAADTSIEAIQIQHRDCDTTEWIECELLIDCSASHRVFRKLIAKDAKFYEPKLERYTMNVTYNTAFIDIHPSLINQIPMSTISNKIPEQERRDQLAIVFLFNPTFSNSDMFFLFARQESNRFVLGSMEYCSDVKSSLPHSLDSMQESFQTNYYTMFGKDVEPWFIELMDFLRKNEELMNQQIKFNKLIDVESYSYNFENLSREKQSLPNNLILLGDSYAKLNPAFGQGAQKASGEAMTLHSVLLDNANFSITKVVNAFNNSRHHYTYRMFKLNRALDLSQSCVQLANPHLSSKIGEFERKKVKALWNYIVKTKDLEMGRLFWSITLIGSVPPAMLIHPYYSIRILYAKYFM